MKFMALDLEMNSPSNTIIQIGYTVFDPVIGYMYEDHSHYIYTQETIDPFITKLTGITKDHMKNALSMEQAFEHLCTVHKKHECLPNFVVFGGNDHLLLKKQTAFLGQEWKFGSRCLDVKTVYQFWKLANNKDTIKGSLARALTYFGKNFIGTKHNAKDDAFNTARLFIELIRYMKNCNDQFTIDKVKKLLTED